MHRITRIQLLMTEVIQTTVALGAALENLRERITSIARQVEGLRMQEEELLNSAYPRVNSQND